MPYGTLSAITRVLLALCVFALPIAGNAQSSSRNIPTAAQAAAQKKPANNKTKMRGTTNSERWQAAIRNADRRAARIRAGRKGAK